MIFGLILSIAATTVTATALWTLLDGRLPTAISMHAFACMLALLAARMLRRGDWRCMAFDAIVSVMVPILGVPLLLLHACGERLRRRRAVREDFEDYLAAGPRTAGANAALDIEEITAPEQLVPLIDVLNSQADDEYKRRAIISLARLETYQAITILRQALTNSSTEVRFYAAHSIAQLERRLLQRIGMLEDDLHRGHGSEIDATIHLKLAQACFDYTYFQLRDSQHRMDQLHRALDHARTAHRDGGLRSALIMIGRILIAMDRSREAEQAFDRYLSEHPKDVKALLWRAEARFQRGDYQGVHADCLLARQLGPVPLVMREPIAMWTEGMRREAS